MIFELSAFIFPIVLFCFVFLQRRSKSFPSVPFCWPIIGNFAQVGLEPYKAVMNMRKKYGDIIGLHLGPKKAVFINEYGLAKEAFNTPTLNGRPNLLFLEEPQTGILRGIIGTTGKEWTEQRRFAFSYIQSGFRNGVPIENLILYEANKLIEYLKENCGQTISTDNVFNIPTINSLWSIIAGERYSVKDPTFLKITEHLGRIMSNAAGQGIFVYFPKWSKIFPRLSGYKYVMASVNNVLEFAQEVINRHKENYDKEVQRDFVDCYIQKIRSTTDNSSSFFGNDGEENLKHCLFDILLAGTEPVASTLRWIVYLMAYHLQIQNKLCNIITKQLPPGKLPALKDRQKLPYVEAVIMEVLRFSSIGPVGVLHEAAEDVKFHGYLIPKGTLVVANLYAISHDTDVWGDPEKFRPERFLNEAGELDIVNHQPLTAFSVGRRVCPGDSLARNELFLFTIRLFQSFTVEFDPNEPFPRLGYINGMTLSPISHKVIFSKR